MTAAIGPERRAESAPPLEEIEMLAVVIATTGRPDLIRPTLVRLGGQSRPAGLVLLVPGRSGDLPAGVEALAAEAGCRVEVVQGPLGLTAQRNAGLDWLAANTGIYAADDGIVVFFDDDFVPHVDWLGNAAAEFARHRPVVGLTGAVVADGVKGRGLAEAEAEQGLRAARPGTRLAPATLYGCNMAFRAAAVPGLRFDETLPLYGWQEDYDFSQRLARAGAVMRAESLLGVHLGSKSGRVSGLRFGYSQVANPFYLMRKGTMGPGKLARVLGGNLFTNVTRSVFPEEYVDRRGRLRGNAMAFRDLLRGRLDPNAIMAIAPAPRPAPATLGHSAPSATMLGDERKVEP